MFAIRDNFAIGYSLGQVVLIDLLSEKKTKYLNTKSSFVLYSILNFKDEGESIAFLKEFNMFQDEECIRTAILGLKEELKYQLIERNNTSQLIDNNIDLKRLLNSNKVRFRNKFRLDYPVKLVWIPTWRCNKNCLYCGVEKIRPDEAEEQIPIEIMYERLKEAIDKGVKEVTIHGGDPVFCYNDNIFGIINFLKRHNVRTSISTKNYISIDKVRRLKDAGLDRIQLSIDTIDENILEILYGDLHYVEKFEDTVKNLKMGGVKPTINIVLSNVNYKGIIPLLEYLTKLEVEEVNISNFRKGDINPVDYSLNKEEQNWLYEEFSKNSHRFNFKKFSCDIFGPELKSGKEKAICESCRISLVILPDGRCCYCDFLSPNEEFLFGDLKKETLEEIWSSDKVIGLLNLSKKRFEHTGCSKCIAFDECIERGLCFVTSCKKNKFGPDYKSLECYEMEGENHGVNFKR